MIQLAFRDDLATISKLIQFVELQMPTQRTPIGDPTREAIDSLRGYVYQIYQSTLAWTELDVDEFLFLEVAEDFAVVAEKALQAVQVKDTARRVTINSEDIVASIDSFVELQEGNPNHKVTLRHLTTSTIGVERKLEDRVGGEAVLLAWRNLAKAGDLKEIRRALGNSKLSKKTKVFVTRLDDDALREKFLKRIHFDCGALEYRFLAQQVNSKVSKLLLDRGGVHSQTQACAASILLTILKLSIKPSRDERVVDRSGLEELLEAATQVTLNKAQFEEQNRLLQKALSVSVSSELNLSHSQLVRPSPVSETPLPKALARREDDILRLQKSLEKVGVCCISGAAGMGKTVAARVLAHANGGNWASINVRGQSREQIASILFQAGDVIKDFDLRGLIVDDLGHVTEPTVTESLCYLFHSVKRSDVLLVMNSHERPCNEFIFNCDLNTDISHNLAEFSEADIREILEKYGVRDTNWAKYIYLVSGGGHPQLAIAFIQSMNASNWDPIEFQTLNALLVGSPAVEEIRKRTRQRLLNDLPKSSRLLIERLSLKTGSFNRELAIDLGKIEPQITDTGIILETLIGSWVDQQEGNRFDLSPLLSGYATKTLDVGDRRLIESAIAVSLTKGRSFEAIDMNAALMAAWSSENDTVILKLCTMVLYSDYSRLEKLAPYLPMFRLFSTDTLAYPSNAVLSHMFRGVQVILLNQDSESSSKIQDAIRCFSDEAANVESEEVRASMNLLIYVKLLLQTPKVGMGVAFTDVISELDQLLEKKSGLLSDELLDGSRRIEKNAVPTIGFMFINQLRQLTRISELPIIFEFIEEASLELRSRLLAPLNHDDFEADFFVSAPWLREHNENTIDPKVHGPIFARLEEDAMRWNCVDLAVCCRKYQAIIWDESGKIKRAHLLS